MFTWVSHEAHMDVTPQLHACARELLAHTTNHLQQQRLHTSNSKLSAGVSDSCLSD
jgi:hypothetical protein